MLFLKLFSQTAKLTKIRDISIIKAVKNQYEFYVMTLPRCVPAARREDVQAELASKK